MRKIKEMFSLVICLGLWYVYDMAVEQTVEIPPNRRLFIDVPPEVPVGRTILTFTPASPPVTDKPKPPVEGKTGEKSLTPHTDALVGILAGLGDLTREEVREIRLAKYLK